MHDYKAQGTNSVRLYTQGEHHDPGLQFSLDLFNLEYGRSHHALLFAYIFHPEAELFLSKNLQMILSIIENDFNIRVVAVGGAKKEKSGSEPWGYHTLDKKREPAIADGQQCSKELGLLYKIEYQSVLNPGLFIDQRQNRVQLADFIKLYGSGPLLNLFSYTGAFSVLAAHYGCKTTSVDSSKKYSLWQRHNHQLNMQNDGHRFIVDDCRTYLERVQRRIDKAAESEKESLRYKFVIIDPPTFSRSKNSKEFSVRRDLPQMVQRAASVMRQREFSAMLIACNDTGWEKNEFLSQMAELGQRHGFSAREGNTPEDVTPNEYLKHHYMLRSVWLLRKR